MALPIVTVFAPRKSKRDPDNPQGQRVVFTERHVDHPRTDFMPAGQAFLAEGDVAKVALTTEVKKKIQAGVLTQRGKDADLEAVQAEANQVDPNSLHNLDLTAPTRAALEAGGIEGIDELVEAHRAGRLAEIQGVGENRVKQIELALKAGGHISSE